jgi:ubiquinone biosynthesis protein UbiJ
MPATPAWLAAAEALLNRCVDASAQAAALARRLEGTSLQIDVVGYTRLRACAHHGRLALAGGDEVAVAPVAAAAGPAARDTAGGAAAAGAGTPGPAAPGAVISGSPAALLKLARGGAQRDPKDAVQVRGDAEIANLYRELFRLARPDPEEELSRWIGDLPARRLSQFAARALEAARRLRRTAGENIAEYLQEEGRDLVNKTELDEFLRGVDDLRETADRVEARLQRLERRARGGA